jgi:hypothetical protein
LQAAFPSSSRACLLEHSEKLPETLQGPDAAGYQIALCGMQVAAGVDRRDQVEPPDLFHAERARLLKKRLDMLCKFSWEGVLLAALAVAAIADTAPFLSSMIRGDPT